MDDKEVKIPGFYVAPELHQAMRKAAYDGNMSIAELLRSVLVSSPTIQQGAKAEHLDLSNVQTHKPRGGYRDRKSAQADNSVKPATTAAERRAAAVRKPSGVIGKRATDEDTSYEDVQE
jgi:hypothetical protein